jgi:hypothetical protein
VNSSKTKENLLCDISLDNIKSATSINPYIDLFKYKGFDISFDEDDFNLNPTLFKKSLLNLVKKYSKGKYFLFYNNQTDEIEIISK